MPLLGKTFRNVGAILAGLMTFAPEVYYGTDIRLEAVTTTSEVPTPPNEAPGQPKGLDEFRWRWVEVGMVADQFLSRTDVISTSAPAFPASENRMALATEEDLKQYQEDRRPRAEPQSQSDICRNNRIYFYRGNHKYWHCARVGQRRSGRPRAA
jgi:hypothetical protein